MNDLADLIKQESSKNLNGLTRLVKSESKRSQQEMAVMVKNAFQGNQEYMDKKFDATDEKFNAIDKRFEALTGEMRSGFNQVTEKINNLSRNTVDVIHQEDFDKLESRVVSLEKIAQPLAKKS